MGERAAIKDSKGTGGTNLYKVHISDLKLKTTSLCSWKGKHLTTPWWFSHSLFSQMEKHAKECILMQALTIKIEVKLKEVEQALKCLWSQQWDSLQPCEPYLGESSQLHSLCGGSQLQWRETHLKKLQQSTKSYKNMFLAFPLFNL